MRARLAVIVVAVAGLAVAASGCRKKPAPEVAANVDAGGTDAAPSPVVLVPFAIVAEGPFGVKGEMTADGKIVVIDGPTLYEAKPSGALEPIMRPSELAKLIVEDDVVVGYSTTYAVDSVAGTLAGPLFVRASRGGYTFELFAWSGGKVTHLPGKYHETLAYRGHALAWDPARETFSWADGATLPLPEVPPDVGVQSGRFTAGPRGSVLAMAGDSDHQRILLWEEGSPKARDLALPDGEQRCDVIPSFADRLVLVCTSKAYTLEGDRFVPTPARDDVHPTARSSQDATGAMHIVADDKVHRCPPDVPCAQREVPRKAVVRAASYRLEATEFVRKEGEDFGEAYQTLAVESAYGDPGWNEIVQILARGPNDVWLFVRAGTRTQILHTSPAPASPKMLPSAADARIALRNERPATRWTGPCDQIYVRLGSDPDAIAKREKEIVAAIGDEPNWALVEGTIDGQRGVGVVLARTSPVQKISFIENAARKLVKAFTTGPANEPPAYCTLPVLERTLLP